MKILDALVAVLLCFSWSAWGAPGQADPRKPSAATSSKADSAKTNPGESSRGRAGSGKAGLGKARSSEAKPARAKPGEAKPGEAKPGEAKPGEAMEESGLPNVPEVEDLEARKWEGFRGIKWGADVSELDGMVRFAQTGNAARLPQRR